MIDRVMEKLERKIYEVPVGFKWFVDNILFDGSAFVGQESEGPSFAHSDDNVWTMDKDGPIMCSLAAEITAKTDKDPGEIYRDLTKEFSTPAYGRLEAPATPAQKVILKKLSPQNMRSKELAGEEIKSILTKAPGNNASIGGIKVITENGWFAARPSGTQDIYKIYAESFFGEDLMNRILTEAQTMVDKALSSASKTK